MVRVLIPQFLTILQLIPMYDLIKVFFREDCRRDLVGVGEKKINGKSPHSLIYNLSPSLHSLRKHFI